MGWGYRLNPGEAEVASYIQQQAAGAPGEVGPALFQLLQGVIGGATERRQTNIAEREQGLDQLRQLAMQYAAAAADPAAVSAAVTGQAGELPGMGGARGARSVAELASFVDSLYGGGDVSGLAPADYRAQFEGAGGLDESDLQAIGSIVVPALQEGVPFKDIREQVRQISIGSGMGESEVNAAVLEAERMYEQAVGVDLADVRSVGDLLRNLQVNPGIAEMGGADYPSMAAATGAQGTLPITGKGANPMLTPSAGVSSGPVPQTYLSQIQGITGLEEFDPAETFAGQDVTGWLARLASQDPEVLRQLTQVVG